MLALAARMALGQAVTAPFVTFIPAILISTLAGGIGPGLLSVAITAAMANYFFLPNQNIGLLYAKSWFIDLVFLAITTAMVVLTNIAMVNSIRLGRVSAELHAANEKLTARMAARTSALIQAEEQLRQSQKMEAVGQLTGGIAHDFNNLLTGITGSLDMLQTRLIQGRTQDFRRYIEAAQDSANRAATLINRLLAFSRPQPLKPIRTDINQLVAGMRDLIARTIPSGISLDVRYMPHLPATLVDPNQLEHALLNLCINAADAMPQGGSLTISTGHVILNARQASAHGLQPGDYDTLIVQDTGVGMPPDVQARAFDPFFTTKSVGQGTGLGLSMIYGFARQSGGHVSLMSTPGHGTMVTLYLPCQAGESPSQPGVLPAETPPARATKGAGRPILIVDDEPNIRMLLADILQDEGYHIHQEADAAAAMRCLRHLPALDLLITDIGLPGMNGAKLANAARELHPNLRFLFITGYADDTTASSAPVGAPILRKPFNMTSIPPLVQALLAE